MPVFCEGLVDYYDDPRKVSAVDKNAKDVGTALCTPLPAATASAWKSFKIKNKNISSDLKLAPAKLHYSMLVKDASKISISDYQAQVGRTGGRVLQHEVLSHVVSNDEYAIDRQEVAYRFDGSPLPCSESSANARTLAVTVSEPGTRVSMPTTLPWCASGGA
ncbi:hypothetical protein PHYSODRAFT_264685 [Phytophthora sojae]|uniref:Uncharacterized protein n=1 Tax=Phytophthora sojae (strain P6497) TaxID=1094619 RepID=G4ZZ55_PHYSP|nr:hypothetical protein PHYSODRAFT_264685 [Phytophthora sojae]EGZ11077.1 hypothetical protein PHYSODRAFT_264685 [Phytophthora sojae]|eukprot:XP_009533822.1 hypothetical protein PHYSODRAFT_264685 [Phytophthora sojae]